MYNPFTSNIYEAERFKSGEWFYKLFSSDNQVLKLKSEKERLNAVLSNPAALKVFKLQCDMFSLGEIKAYRNGKVLPNDQLANFLKHPNFYQTQRQFLWDYMFWTMLGTSYLYFNSKVLNDNTKLYWLDPSRFVWTDDLIEKLDKNVLSKQVLNEQKKLTIDYYNLDGTYTTYQLKDIMPFFDLSNGIGNWFRGNSAIDALYKVISNSEKGLDAKGVNLDFSAKYFVSGTHKEEDIYGTPMGDAEQQSIEDSLKGKKPVHATKSMIDLKRFVDDIAKLKLDEGYNEDTLKMGSMYGIPKTLLQLDSDSLISSDDKNRDKISYVDMCLKPKGNDLVNGLENIFGYTERNIDLTISWSHLDFMQIAEKERASLKSTQLANLSMAKEMGLLTEEDVMARGKEIMEIDG